MRYETVYDLAAQRHYIIDREPEPPAALAIEEGCAGIVVASVLAREHALLIVGVMNDHAESGVALFAQVISDTNPPGTVWHK